MVATSVNGEGRLDADVPTELDQRTAVSAPDAAQAAVSAPDAAQAAVEQQQIDDAEAAAKAEEREAFEQAMRDEDAARKLPTRIQYLNLADVKWSPPVIPEKKVLTQQQKQALARAAKAAAMAGKPPPKSDNYGPSMFLWFKGRKFNKLHVRFDKKMRVPFTPSNDKEALWLNPQKPAKINVSLTDEEDAETIAKLRAIEDSAVAEVVDHSYELLGEVLDEEQVRGCMFGLLRSKTGQSPYALGMKCYPRLKEDDDDDDDGNGKRKKLQTLLASITGFVRDDDGVIVDVGTQDADVTNVVKNSELIPDLYLASSLWFRPGKGMAWGFLSTLVRSPVYPPDPNKDYGNTYKQPTIAGLANLMPELCDGKATLTENAVRQKVPVVGEEEDGAAGADAAVVTYEEPEPTSSGRASKRASVDAAIGGGGASKSSIPAPKTKRGRKKAAAM